MAQEFESPGAHMASMKSNNNSGSGLHATNVIYSPSNYHSDNAPYYDAINKDFENYVSSNFGGSPRSFNERVDNFNRDYMNYNTDLYHSARSWSEMMSNTAIQRQIKDLIAAGLNPVLATRLGGAAYQSPNVPYISISPHGALQAYTGYESSMYATNLNNATNKEIAQLQTSSNEFIARYNKVMERLMQGERFVHDNDLELLKTSCDKYLQDARHLDDIDLQKLGFMNQKELEAYKQQLDYDYWKSRNMYGSDDDPDSYIFRYIDKLSGLMPGANTFAR